MTWKKTLGYVIDFQTIPEFYEEGFTGAAQFRGVSTMGHKLITVGAEKIPVYVSKGGKISAISGEGPVLGEEPGNRCVVEGLISITAGKAQEDVSNYPNLEMAD